MRKVCAPTTALRPVERSRTSARLGARGQGLAEYALAAGVLAGLGFAVLAVFQQWIEVAEQALLHAVNG